MIKEGIAEQLTETPFVPHAALKNAHAQTIMATLIPRRLKLIKGRTESRYFDVAPGVRLMARCTWQQDCRSSPTLVIVHGLEGSSDRPYMLGTAEKALAAGFNAIRLNLRNCGGTEHLSPTMYHAGLTEDLRHIVQELVERDGLNELYLAGFSLGGNMVLKLAGEYGRQAPGAVRGIVAISPSIHLSSAADAIELRSNFIYNISFLFSLRDSIKRKARLFPESFDVSRLNQIWSIREFDDAFTAPHSGFRDVADYYERASSRPLISSITIPTLIIQAKDDPFIPFAPFECEEIAGNSSVLMIAPDRGGHVGFISATGEGEERFWAEVKLMQFIRMLAN